MPTENIECVITGKILTENEKKQEINTTKEKLCPKCNLVLDINLFYKDITTNTGYKCYCKNCIEINRQQTYNEEKISGIYKIINTNNGKYYVGGSKNICGQVNGRWNRHKQDLIKNIHDNDHLQRAWNKYGMDSFNFVITECVDDDKLLIVEQKYLDIAKTEIDKCYNICFVAGKVNMTPEVRKKIGDALRGRLRPDISERLKGTKIPYSQRQKMGSKGIKNSSYDHTIYTFFNKFTKETYVNTRYEFYTKYSLDGVNISRLIRKKYLSYKGWIIIK